MRKRPLIAFLNLQSASKILKAQIGVIRKLEVLLPCSQMFFSIAAIKKEACQLQKENTGKVIHNQMTRPLLLFQEEVSPKQIVFGPKLKNSAFKNYQYYLNHKSNILDEFWEV